MAATKALHNTSWWKESHRGRDGEEGDRKKELEGGKEGERESEREGGTWVIFSIGLRR